MPAARVQIQTDDDPAEVATLASVLADNGDDEDVVEALKGLNVGDTVTFGGGAQPLVTITGLASATPS